jgi:hypothetical protein
MTYVWPPGLKIVLDTGFQTIGTTGPAVSGSGLYHWSRALVPSANASKQRHR